jgi:hypothetical protein
MFMASTLALMVGSLLGKPLGFPGSGIVLLAAILLGIPLVVRPAVGRFSGKWADRIELGYVFAVSWGFALAVLVGLVVLVVNLFRR